MDSNRIVLFCIFIITAFTNTHFAFGQHEPLYISKSYVGNDYYLIYDVEYEDGANKQLVVIELFGDEVFVACPQVDDLKSLEIRNKLPKKAPVSLDCKTPIKSRVFKTTARNVLADVIGFMISTPTEEHPRNYEDVPEHHTVVSIIRFKFDKTLFRIKSVEYRLGIGKFLEPEISGKYQTNEDQKNSDIFGYDLDDLYFRTFLPMVKVPLAPEEDFFFSNWKSASKHNVLTAPMWQQLLVQWQALEIFTRKVAQIIDSVHVKTGVYETLTKPRLGRSPQQIFLHDEKHPIPKYFWKAIYIEIVVPSFKHHDRGILFVMHNVDPLTKSNEEKICPNDDVSKLGWKFLPDNFQMKSLMYACFLNKKNLEFFQEKEMNPLYGYKPFDLNKVPVKITDSEGNTTGVKEINVLEEMGKLEKAKQEGENFTLSKL
ncbi:uncharacterized protein LOC135848955 [Planococcus citri]|uniref:uncharacterized protein LOC135848955 n=1 Tax=Planococcus citri TaxID=170843 RepID=UPI0031F8AF88